MGLNGFKNYSTNDTLLISFFVVVCLRVRLRVSGVGIGQRHKAMEEREPACHYKRCKNVESGTKKILSLKNIALEISNIMYVSNNWCLNVINIGLVMDPDLM